MTTLDFILYAFEAVAAMVFIYLIASGTEK